jgi:hypothetical protein
MPTKQSSEGRLVSRELDGASLKQITRWLEMCREDLSFSLNYGFKEPELRIQGTIEMITRILNDHEKWEAFKKQWNVPWDNTPSNWA